MTRYKKTPTSTLAALAAAFCLLSPALAAPAQAQAAEEKIQMRFSFSPSDPPERIYQGLRHAAAEACRYPEPRPLSLVKEEQACTRRLLDKAVASIGRSDVAQLHSGLVERRG